MNCFQRVIILVGIRSTLNLIPIVLKFIFYMYTTYYKLYYIIIIIKRENYIIIYTQNPLIRILRYLEY